MSESCYVYAEKNVSSDSDNNDNDNDNDNNDDNVSDVDNEGKQEKAILDFT